jgi:hypothetical protein
MSIMSATLSGVTVSSPESIEIISGKSGGKAKTGIVVDEVCNSSTMDCEKI